MPKRKDPNRVKRQLSPNSLKNLIPVKPGQVLNPKGYRPRPLTERLMDRIEQRLEATDEGRQILKSMNLPKGSTWADAIVEQRVRRATVERTSEAFNTLADRVEGRPAQRMEVSTPADSEIVLKIKYDDPMDSKKDKAED